VDLGILNPIYERELSKPDVHQAKWIRKVAMSGEEGEVNPHRIN
jgi:hypothetical protein